MARLIIVYSEPGEGKTYHADALKALFRCDHVFEEFMPGLIPATCNKGLVLVTAPYEDCLETCWSSGHDPDIVSWDTAKMLLELQEGRGDLFDFQWALSEKIGHHEDLDCGEITSELSRQFRITSVKKEHTND